MELTDVPGLGPAKAKKLQSSGVNSVRDLAELDLRRPADVGVPRDTLKKLKQEARKMLRAEGVEFEKAPYATGAAPATAKAKPKAKATTTAKAKADAKPIVRAKKAPTVTKVSAPAAEAEPKPGFFKRLLRL